MNAKPFRTELPVDSPQIWMWAGKRKSLAKEEYDKLLKLMESNGTDFIEVKDRIYVTYQRTTKSKMIRQMIEIDRRAFDRKH